MSRDLVQFFSRVVSRDCTHRFPRHMAIIVHCHDLDGMIKLQIFHVLLRHALNTTIVGRRNVRVNPFANFDVFGLIVFNDNHRGFPCHGFHSGVNETHATTHGVKEELLRREPRNEGVLHEAARPRRVVVFREVRQRAVFKPVGDALAVNELLPEARNHLRNVQIAALGPRLDHGHEAVVLVQALQPDLARVVCGLVQNVGDLELKLVLVGVACGVLKDAEIGLVNQVLHLLLFGSDGLRDLLVRAAIGNEVADADAVSAALHVLRDDVLQVVNEVGCRHVAEVVAGARDEAVAASAEHVLVQLPAQILAVHDLQHTRRSGKIVVFSEALGLVFHGECRHDLRQDLEAGDAVRVPRKQPFVDAIVRHEQIHGIARRKRHAGARQTV